MVIIAILLASCQPVANSGKLVQADLPRVVPPELPEEQLALLSDGNNAFAFDLYRKISQQETGNLIYSPYSIWLAFSMVYAGARGETESQMVDVFHFLAQDEHHVSLNALDQRLQAADVKKGPEEDGTPFQLNLANAVWAQQGYTINPSYLDLLAAQYGAGLHVLDFQAARGEAIKAINAWVDENTDSRIKNIADEGSITPDTRFVLTNAILFKAGWLNEFDPEATADGPFTLIDGSQVTIPLMHLTAQLEFAETPDYQAVKLPYANREQEMWIILPTEGRFNAVRDELSPALMNEIVQASGYGEVSLTMPGFEYESELTLSDLLVQMGLTQAFCPAGNFNGIVDGGGLCISDVIHKATIKVDEQGTEATAATMIVMMAAMMKQAEIKVDRPFIFAIMDHESGLILFLGQVLNPAAQ